MSTRRSKARSLNPVLILSSSAAAVWPRFDVAQHAQHALCRQQRVALGNCAAMVPARGIAWRAPGWASLASLSAVNCLETWDPRKRFFCTPPATPRAAAQFVPDTSRGFSATGFFVTGDGPLMLLATFQFMRSRWIASAPYHPVVSRLCSVWRARTVFPGYREMLILLTRYALWSYW